MHEAGSFLNYFCVTGSDTVHGALFPNTLNLRGCIQKFPD